MKVVRNIYQVGCRDRPDQFWGLGDFIRGSLELLRIGRQRNWQVQIYWHNHPMSHFLIPSTPDFRIPADFPVFFSPDSHQLLIDYVETTASPVNVLTNLHLKGPVERQDRETIKMALQFVPEIKEEAANRCPLTNYRVLHIRLGDATMSSNRLPFDKIEKAAGELLEGNWSNLLVMSDNLQIKRHLAKKYGVSYFVGKICHLGKTFDLEAVRDTLIEFYLMSQATEIYQISVYHWGTGFSQWCSFLYDIPLHRKRI